MIPANYAAPAETEASRTRRFVDARALDLHVAKPNCAWRRFQPNTITPRAFAPFSRSSNALGASSMV
jgi:hypothetical protein